MHCMTRLRLILKDQGLADLETIKGINGVLGVQWSGDQLQVIIGQNVPKVYNAVVALGVKSGGSVNENLDSGAKEDTDHSAKGVGKAILAYLQASMLPMIPVLMAAGLFETIASVIGPTMLNIAASDSNIIVLLNFLYNAAFYFMPVYLGYTAAQKLGVTPILGAYMGGILIAPAFVEIATNGTPFDVFGIPCVTGNYSSTVLPVLLSVWVMSYVERFFKKHMPDVLGTVFTPFLTMLVMTPISLCALAPLGGWIGQLIGNALYAMGSMGGIVSIVGGGILAALYLPMVTTGMHLTISMLAMGSLMTTGVDNFVYVCINVALWAVYGAELGTALRLKNKSEKTQAFGYFISNIVGGVGEPFIYGIMFKYGRVWITDAIGAFVGDALAIGLGTKYYTMTASNALNLVAFIGGDVSNLVKGVVSVGIGFIVALIITYLFGFTKEEIEGTAEKQAA